MKKRPEVAEFVKTLKTVQPRRKLSFDQILKGIQNDTLFGLLIVDIHTPTELKPLFADHPLIIKNTMVSREDIGDYMRGVAEKHGFLKKPKRALICSHFGKEPSKHCIVGPMLARCSCQHLSTSAPPLQPMLGRCGFAPKSSVQPTLAFCSGPTSEPASANNGGIMFPTSARSWQTAANQHRNCS